MSIPLSSAGNHSASKTNEVKQMIKSVFAATAALSMSAGAALAGPYVNVETNAGWTGDNYTGATTDIHVGYEGEVGAASYYVQAGPAVVAVDGADTETEFSGKAGIGIPVSDAIGVYGELSFLTADDSDDLGVGGKLGLKYSF
jgi:hypothetical protein